MQWELNWEDCLPPQVEHPLFVWPLLLLKFEHQSFRLNRRKTDEHYSDLHLPHNTDLTLNVQVKFKRKINVVICHYTGYKNLGLCKVSLKFKAF